MHKLKLKHCRYYHLSMAAKRRGTAL